MRADRLLSIVLLLQARGRLTAQALADELEVSIRTVYRDLDALSVAGIPVVAESGHGGGCWLLDSFRSPLAGLTPDEARALLLLGTPQPLSDLGLASVWRTAQRKLATATVDGTGRPPPLDLHLDVQTWLPSQDAIHCLPTIALAIRQRRQLAIVHARPRARAARVVVEPLGLVNKTGVWYVVTQPAAGHTVVYRVGRIESAAMLDQEFTRPAGFDLAAAWTAWSKEFRTSRPQVEVTLRVSDPAFRMLPEIFGDQVQQHMAAASAPDASGWRTLRLPFEHPHAACHRLLGFGAEVEVLAPAAVRALLIETAAAAYGVYCKGGAGLTGPCYTCHGTS